MIERTIKRADELSNQGTAYISKIGYYEGKPEYWFGKKLIPELQKWIASVITIVKHSTNNSTYFYQEVDRIANDKDLKHGVSYSAIQKLTGLISSLKEELELGFLNKFELSIISLTFDNFLDHAADFHSSNKKTESSVLVSIVFEDTIRKLAEKHGIEETGKTIEDIINEMTKNGNFSGVESKRLKSYAALRNDALHAHFSNFEIKEVGLMIKGIRDLIESHFNTD